VIRFGATIVATLALAGEAAANTVSPLTLTSAPTPPFAVPRYDTSGTLPQFAGAGVVGANGLLRAVVLDDQRKYAVTARKVVGWLSPSFKGRGVYETGVVPHLVSGSTEVASAMFPVRALYPGGNDGDRWLSLTVEVPTGRVVEVSDLFAKPASGLAKLAAAARARLLATNRCVAGGERKLLAEGTRPTAENFTHFALVPAGIAVGFQLGQVAESACGRVDATVPYATLRPSLGPLGRRLVAGVRTPRR
jgi:hypothetical protein